MKFASPYSKSECVRLFREAVDSPWALTGTAPVVGWIGLDVLYARKRITYRNSFRTILTARLTPSAQGTRVAVSTGISGVVLLFLAIWFAFIVGVTIAIGFSTDPSGFVFPAGMLVFGVALVAVGRYFAREEAGELTEFLVETLDLVRV